MQRFTCWFRISNSININTLKAAQSSENIKSLKSKQLSRLYSTYLTYRLVHLLIIYCHTERITEALEQNQLMQKSMTSEFWWAFQNVTSS